MYEYVPLPITWDKSRSYTNTPYHLIALPTYSTEYANVAEYFDNYQIQSIERVQNRYQYGRYLIYKLQKQSPVEMTYFMPLQCSEHLNMALRFNCDYRRLNYDRDMFFETPLKATSFCNSYNKLIVVEGLQGYSNHDSGRYPKYVVTCQLND